MRFKRSVMKIIGFCIVFIGILLPACLEKPAGEAADERQLLSAAVMKAGDLMSAGDFEQAQEAIGNIYKTYPLLSEHPDMQYYLLCFESEIFYYNAIFTLGADKAEEALAYCKRHFKSDYNRIGNAWNLLGINSENFLPPAEAIRIYREAERHLGAHKNPLLSYRYHVLSNLGQLCLKAGYNTEALQLLNASNDICRREKVYRTLCINHLALSRLYADSGLHAMAAGHYDSAVAYYDLDKRADLQLFLNTQEARLLWQNGQSDKAVAILKQAFKNGSLSDDPSMGLVDFYRESAALLTLMGAFDFASEVSLARVRLQQHTMQATGELKERIISRHFRNQETMHTQRLEQQQQAQKLKNQRNTIFLLTGLLFSILMLALALVFYLLQRKKLEKSAAMIEAILSERDRISRDFHDGIAPNLSTIKLISESAVQNPQNTGLLERMPLLVDQTIDEIRRMIVELSPRQIIEHGLQHAVEHMAENLQSSGNFRIHVQSDIDGKRYAADAELNLYRVVQEAVHNAIRHSDSKVIDIRMYEQDRHLNIAISDHGLNATDTAQAGNGHGMQNMRARVERLNGTLNLHSERNRGTTVLISIPLSDV